MNIKKCGRCKLEKDIINFSKDKHTKDGFCTACKKCRKDVQRKSYDKVGRETRRKLYRKKVNSQKNGIYEIYNKENNKSYIGKTNAYEFRKKAHIKKLNSDAHANKELQEDWNEFGEESFNFSLIKETNTDKDLEIYEALEVLGRLDNNKEVYNHKFIFTTDELVKLLKVIKGDEKC